MAAITTGNDFYLRVPLTKDGRGFVIDPASVVKVAVVKADRSARLTGPYQVNLAAQGTDLAKSTIVVSLPKAGTAELAQEGPAWLEIELTDPNGFVWQSWFYGVQVVRGNI